jgi:hypothetical protein
LNVNFLPAQSQLVNGCVIVIINNSYVRIFHFPPQTGTNEIFMPQTGIVDQSAQHEEAFIATNVPDGQLDPAWF